MVLAAQNMMEHVMDHPWPGWQTQLFGMKVTLMSSGIASMIIAAALLVAIIVPMARRRGGTGCGVLEVVVIFVRDTIGRPALGERVYVYLPMLLTLFVFILGMNLLGMVPLESISLAARWRPMGTTATAIPTVCTGLASISLLTIIFAGLRKSARHWHERLRLPMWVCAAVSPLLWIVGLCPSIPGTTGRVMAIPMGLLELAGIIFKCLALMIRLMSNMLSGHVLLAVFMMFIIEALGDWVDGNAAGVFYITPACIIASVLVNVLELLVAGLQAYIFTFLTAIFLGLYAEGGHWKQAEPLLSAPSEE